MQDPSFTSSVYYGYKSCPAGLWCAFIRQRRAPREQERVDQRPHAVFQLKVAKRRGTLSGCATVARA